MKRKLKKTVEEQLEEQGLHQVSIDELLYPKNQSSQPSKAQKNKTTKDQALKEDKSVEVEVLVSKSEWISLCKKYGQYCSFEMVKNHTFNEAEYIIKNMPCWVPM